MPVAGNGGEVGAGRAVRASRQPVLLIGVDTDQHYAAPQFVDLWLTSVLKVYRRMVYLAIGETVLGRFESGPIRGNLADGGVALRAVLRARQTGAEAAAARARKVQKGIEGGSGSLDPKSYTAVVD